MAAGTANNAQPLDGNYRQMADMLVSPGTGVVLPQGGKDVLTDPITGQQYAPAMANVSQTMPSILQKAAGVSTGSVATLAKAFANNVTQGNSIVVVAACGNGTAMTVADSLSNTYTSAINAPNSTTFETQIFFAVNTPGGANTVTVTNAGTAASVAVEIYEVNGLIAQVQAQPDQTSISTGTGTTASTPNIAASSPNSLAFAGVAIGTGVVTNFAAGAGLTYDSSTQQPATPSGLFQFASLSGYLASTNALAPGATWTTSRAWSMAVAIFKPVALGMQGTVQIGGYTYTRVTSAGTTLVKTGPGVLHAVACNTPTSTATIELDDAITNTAPIIGKILFAAAATPSTVVYDVAFTTGLSVTVAVATVDATIIWK
jgi:hypothetical protein